MLKGMYNKIKNAHALAALTKMPEVPGASFGTGDAETKISIDRSLRPTPPVQAATVKDVKTMDDILYVGKGAQVDPKQFPKYYYMGEG